MNSVLLIDGQNFKSKIKTALKEEKQAIPEWHEFNFRLLLEKALQGIKLESSVFYFARIKQHPQTQEKSKELIEKQRLLKTHLETQGFKVKLSGRVRAHMEDIASKKQLLVFKEKGVDVQMAVDMISLACGKTVNNKKIDTVVLGSSDSDLQPAIKEGKERGLKCIYLGFESNQNKGLSYTTDRTILIRNSEIVESLKT